MNTQELKKLRLVRRKKHIRNKISVSDDRLRLSIYRSLNHFYAQIINDRIGKTVVAVSTIDKEIRPQIKADMPKVMQSKIVGAAIAKRAVENNIKKVVFDRNGCLYHGRVKAFAEAARENGLEF